MKHHASPKFWDAYEALPAAVQKLADDNFQLLKSNPKHPSLHLKRISRYWSARVGLHYRALGLDVEGDILWFWIGSHADYDKLIGA